MYMMESSDLEIFISAASHFLEEFIYYLSFWDLN